MNLIAFDTTSKYCTVIIYNNGKIFSKSITESKNHSTNIFLILDNIVKESNLDLNSFDYIGIVNGPGSFTGIRIGVAAVKGIAHAIKKPIIEINYLDVLINQINISEKYICPIINANNKQVYSVIKLNNNIFLDYNSYSIYDIIPYSNGNTIFISNEFSDLKDIILNINNKYKIIESTYDPKYIMITMIKNINKSKNYYEISANYLKASQAERMKFSNNNV